MARLTQEDLREISNKHGLEILNPNDYLRLDSKMKFRCRECNTEFSAPFKDVREGRFMCPGCEGQKVSIGRAIPVKTGFRTVAFDQATYNFGYSVFDGNKLVYYGHESFNRSLSLEDRFVQIGIFVNTVCRNWSPDLIVYEDIQLQGYNASGYTTFKVLAQLLGIVSYCVHYHKIKSECVLNKVWQAEFAISGRDRITQKTNCLKKVKELFGVDVTDDEADAILLGFYGVRQRTKKPVVKAF